MTGRGFVGFGFGPIQAGLFLAEAATSGVFERLVVAYRRPEVVAAVRAAGGRIAVNVAHADRVEALELGPIEIYDVGDPADREVLIEAVAEASELATALSSVDDYAGDPPGSVHRLLASGLARKLERGGPSAVVYAAENHHHAARLLVDAVADELPEALRKRLPERVEALDTVIGKMCGTVDDPMRIAAEGLVPVTPGGARAFLVEAFNRILVTRPTLPGFERGLAVFEEKSDLRPFEEAKLHGHNAVHALLAYLGTTSGIGFVEEAPRVPGLMELARAAFLDESGSALIRRWAGADPLFTGTGWRAYADDLLARMTNPFLHDRVARVGRDARRKLGWDDRLVGTMRLVLAEGLEPERFALACAAALASLGSDEPEAGRAELTRLWAPVDPDPAEAARVLARIDAARPALERWRTTRHGERSTP